jgi:hypothetical protein
MQRNRFFIVAIFLIALFGVLTIQTHAQTTAQPQFLITWSASNSYAPQGYAGKILPNQESQITASLAIIANGKLVNLNGQTIYWYQSDAFLGGGVGAQSITFQPTGGAPGTIALRVELPDYPSGALLHEITIPIVQPQAVIEAPYPGKDLVASPAILQAIPYFFAATSTTPLNFAWSVNGQPVTNAENPQSLQISLPQGTSAGYSIAVALSIQDSIDSLGASANTTLTYK